MSASTKLCQKCSELNEISALYCKRCGAKFPTPTYQNEPQANFNSKEKKEDKVLYKDENVLISVTRYVAFNTTYAMRDITSVSITEDEPGRLLPIGIWLFSIAQAFLFDESIIKPWIQSRYLAAITFFMIGIFVNGFYHTKYFVTITNLSGQLNTVQSENREYIQKIVDSLNQAIVERG